MVTICACHATVMGCGAVDNKILVSHAKGNLTTGTYERTTELSSDWVRTEIEHVKKSLLKVRPLRIFYWLPL